MMRQMVMYRTNGAEPDLESHRLSCFLLGKKIEEAHR